MDPVTGLAVAGNVLQFLKLGLTVSSRLKTYCTATAEIPTVYRELSNQIPLIIDTCKRIDNRTSITPELLDHVVKGCTRNLDTLNEILTKITPANGDSVGARVVRGLRSVSNEGKARECKAELETYKTTLTLYLSVQNPYSTHPALDRPTYYRFPSLNQASFIGRKEAIHTIDHILKARGRDTRVAVLLGMGGQGKTSLAIEYCRREKTEGHFKTILWINSVSHLTIQRSFAEIAKNILALEGEQRVFVSTEAQIAFIHSIVESKSTPWLFVFDNYDWPENLKSLLSYAPSSAQGAVIMTTRHADVAQLGTLVPVLGMSEDDAVELFLQRTGCERDVDSLEQAKAVVKLLGYLPLAIDQSSAYIRSRKITPQQFIEHYQNRKEKLLKYVPSVWEYQRSLGEDEGETPLGVFTTWEMSFTQAEKKKPIDGHLGYFLTTLAFFSRLQIRMEMFQAYYEEIEASGPKAPAWLRSFSDNATWDKYEYQDVIAILSEHSLLRHGERYTDDDEEIQDATGFCTVALHPLVRDWMQLRTTVEDRREHAIEALIILGYYIKTSGDDYRNWSLKVRLQALAHVDASLELQSLYAEDWAETHYDDVRKAFGQICTFYADNGRYDQAEKICQKILQADMKAKTMGDQTELAKVQLTNIFLLQGRYDEVESMISQTLASSKGDGDIATKVRLEKILAKAFSYQGRYDEAVVLYHAILEQQLSFLSSNSLDVVNTNENLAYVYRNKGLHSKAVSLFETVLEAYRAAGLENRLDALQSTVNLANTYHAQAHYDLATPLYEKASTELSAKLHADHPTALSTNSFKATNLRELQRYEEAETTFRDVVERSARTLGLLHPDTLKATMNFAILCDRTGKLLEAEELYRTTLIGREQKLGMDNPYTLRTVERLVSLLWNKKCYDEALEITTKILKAQKRSSVGGQMEALNLDSPHDNSMSVKYRPVERLFVSAVARDNATLGEAHRDRIETQRSLSQVYQTHGKIQEAEELQRAVKIGEEILRQRLERFAIQLNASQSTLVNPDV